MNFLLAFLLVLIRPDVCCWCRKVEAKEEPRSTYTAEEREHFANLASSFVGFDLGAAKISIQPEHDDKLMRQYLDAKREGDALKLEALRSLMLSLGDTPAVRIITLAEKLMSQPEIFSDLLRRLPQHIQDQLAALVNKRDWFHQKGRNHVEIFVEAFREDPDTLLGVVEVLLEIYPNLVDIIDEEIAQRRAEWWKIPAMILTPIASIIIIGYLLEDPNEIRRMEKREKKRMIDEQRLRESPNKPRPVVVLNEKQKAKAMKRKEGKRRKTQLKLTVDEEKRQKQLWMKGIHRVHLEARSKFKRIRQELDAMNLERIEPKQKNKKEKPAPQSMPSFSTLSTAGADKKAGKSQYIVLVGDPNNLYKTRNIKRSISQVICIDLHGMSKNEALSKLDEHLPQWIDVAMRGSYPFVIPVKIICGKGSQTLSEAVAEWIRKKKEVSNAPKDLVK